MREEAGEPLSLGRVRLLPQSWYIISSCKKIEYVHAVSNVFTIYNGYNICSKHFSSIKVL